MTLPQKPPAPPLPKRSVKATDFHFDYVVPTAEAKTLLGKYRDAYKELLESIISDIPDGRERALAITNLETSLMFTCKSIIVGVNK